MADKLRLDKSEMKDRATAHLRIYVGGLTEKSTVDGIYEHFQEYGQINGIAINKGFGFVQFNNEYSVQAAINNGNGSVYDGKNLIVRPAVTTDKRKETEVVHIPNHLPHAVMMNDNHSMEEEDDEDNQYDSFGNFIGDSEDRGELNAFRGRGRGYRGRSRPRGRGRGGGPPPPLGFRDRSPLARGPEWADRGPYGHARPMPLPDRNDCEIIVVSKTLTEYAEYIESRLKQLGIVVDLLYPMEDVPIGKVLGNIASRGCLYAILVMPINMQKRSLTLSVLHGMPQEFRNVPIDDAMSILGRNFEEVKRGGGAAGRDAVFALLGQLADGRALTAAQYRAVITYLTERMDKQAKLEEGLLNPSTNEVKLEDVLQKRILSILNEKKAASEDAAPAAAAPPAPAPPAAAPPPPPPATQNPPRPALLNDPTVRKALDSILQKFL